MSLINASHDSLPYIDRHTPEQLASARALISASLPPAHELSKPHPLLPPPSDLNLTPSMQAEMARVSESKPLTAIDTSVYELPDLDITNSDLSEDMLRKAYVSYEYLKQRQQALDLLERFGKNAWLVHSSQLEDVLRGLEKEYVETKEAVERTNKERKTMQVGREGELRAMEREWKEGVGRCLEVEVALREMEEEKAKVLAGGS